MSFHIIGIFVNNVGFVNVIDLCQNVFLDTVSLPVVQIGEKWAGLSAIIDPCKVIWSKGEFLLFIPYFWMKQERVSYSKIRL